MQTSELDFQDKTVLVTGSGRNIGRAILLEFARRGANVVVNARSNRAEAEAVAAEAAAAGVGAIVVLGEPSDPAVVDAMHEQARDAFGGIDIYVSNAATRLYRSFFDTSNVDWHYYLNQQLSASWYLAKSLVPYMQDQGWGRIIHINGPDGFRGGWLRVPHSVAKGALRTLTKSLAEGLGPYGITVNDVSPGLTNTERDPVTHPQLTPEEISAQASTTIPIRRQPTMEEVAWACAFLASPRSAGITGSAIHVDGGQYKLG